MTPRVRIYAEQEAARHGADVAAVLGRDRGRKSARARQAVMRRLAADGFTFTQIGRWMQRDHSTVFHAVRNGACL